MKRVGSNGPWTAHTLQRSQTRLLELALRAYSNVMSRDIQTGQSELDHLVTLFIVHFHDAMAGKMDDLVQLECQLELEIQTYKDQVRVQPVPMCYSCSIYLKQVQPTLLPHLALKTFSLYALLLSFGGEVCVGLVVVCVPCKIAVCFHWV